MSKRRTAFARRFARLCAVCLPFLLLSSPSVAGPLSPGSVLASFPSDFVGEFSSGGTLLQPIHVPNPSQIPGTVGGPEIVRDIELTPDGRLAIFNGTFTPHLTIWNPADDSFVHQTFPGWTSDGNSFFGRLAAYKNFVFATDNANAIDSLFGVVRFDLTSPGQALRFMSINPFDVAVASDGLLYVLGTDGLTVQVFDAETASLLRTIALQHQVFGIGGSSDGGIIGASNVGGLIRFDAFGNILKTEAGPGIGDIDIGVNGAVLGLIIGFQEGIFLGNQDLTGGQLFELGGASFVAFGGATESLPVSEPPTAVLLSVVLLFGLPLVRSVASIRCTCTA